MRLKISKEFEDIKFAVEVLDPKVGIVSCDEGISINADGKELEGFEECVSFLLDKYQPDRSVEDVKRIRDTLVQEPIKKQFTTLLSYYHHFKSALEHFDLDVTDYLDELTYAFDLHYLYFYFLNIQIGKVVEVKYPNYRSVNVEVVDVGDTIEVVSNTQNYFSENEYEGESFLYLTNIKPSYKEGVRSYGIQLYGKKGANVAVFNVPDDLTSGTRLELEKPNIVSEYKVDKIDLSWGFFNRIFDKLKLVDGYVEFEGLKGCVNGSPLRISSVPLHF